MILIVNSIFYFFKENYIFNKLIFELSCKYLFLYVFKFWMIVYFIMILKFIEFYMFLK